ncbi:hypothetical protein DBR00_01350 [Pseudomonas sp. HMWF032]|uniref:hypothetical protein n=1 Tax=unclassified Pseudomonas TaxID=196821 RepID=UPI000D3CB534|nr:MULTISPECIES: hypothetical protein [unclassified Pseudomonas]PTS86719.1 hypothetical protein DBR00_01350 [Pseudomonas sp. HMWF032]PTT79470.1 hypothetical protein DBR41_21805 [Pseudomonas sp. HMWF010]WAC43433.1 hypothetical protein OU997_14275 [Pseudomonas sp. SL4(2022)]
MHRFGFIPTAACYSLMGLLLLNASVRAEELFAADAFTRDAERPAVQPLRSRHELQPAAWLDRDKASPPPGAWRADQWLAPLAPALPPNMPAQPPGLRF